MVKDLLTSFTSICRMFPINGRGVGPGGSFPLPELCLQSERRSRQETVSTRTVTRSMPAFSSQGDTPELAVQSFYNARCELNMRLRGIRDQSVRFTLIFLLCGLWPVEKYKRKLFFTLTHYYSTLEACHNWPRVGPMDCDFCFLIHHS